MKKTTRKPKSRRAQQHVITSKDVLPTVRERDFLAAARGLCELYPMTELIGNSYVLSRFWAWFSQIQISPRVRIPMPRFLTQRDP